MTGYSPALLAVPACLRLADEVFPRARGEAARRLLAQGWSQADAARALGISQPMVSRHARRAAEADPVVVELGRTLAEELIDGRVDAPGNPWCDILSTDHADGEQASIRSLLAARSALVEAPPFGLLPQVGMNLVERPNGDGATATGPAEVYGFPGRLVFAAGRLVHRTPPAKGASDHLARCLLAIPATFGLRAMANVAAHEGILAAARQLAPVHALDPGETDRPAAIRGAADGPMPSSGTSACFFHDKGGFGIEPCLYVAGPDAVAVAQTIRTLHSAHEETP